MRHLSEKRNRFLSCTSNYSTLYKYTNKKEQIAYSSGVLNFIWNNWNNFWRDYWLTHVKGGFYVDKTHVTPIFNNYTDKQACHFLLYKLKRRSNHNGDSITGGHQEVTWGDPNIINLLSIELVTNHAHLSFITGMLSIYKTNIEHFQVIRNTFTHLNNENVTKLKNLSGYYSFSSGQRLLDILETTNIATSNKCYVNLINNLTGMVQNL